METETQRAEKETAARGANLQMCPSCGVALVEGMRFCRACGYRLGEGMAEYVETVRFDRMTNMSGVGEGNQSLAGAPGAQTTLMSPVAPAPPQTLGPGRQRRKGRKWLAFLLMFLLFIPVAAVGSRFLFRAIRDSVQRTVGFDAQRDQPRSFFGASEFGDTEGAGALLSGAMPGSPAERAGLIDGDIITKIDGKMVNGEDAMRDALRETPIGKTVEVVYLRDGETKTTNLTTISSEDYNSEAFMPKERGMLGIDDTARIPVEGTKIHGVRLGDVYANRPADLAGLKEGDVVVEFDGKPVRTVEGLFGYINFAKPASTVNVVVYREGQRVTIPVKMGRRT
ncbi:MAG TPA: PDZ domain-containing protein [Pyrinomonadaceae bacterium]|jgi:membrane-associated protease RseP (regulator of RpoE activity)